MTGFGCRCGARWTGRRTAHCGGCHATFGAPGGFDRHRRRGACVEPPLVGLSLGADGRWRLPLVGDGPTTRRPPSVS